ncbi:hypothetical protein D3C73_1209370 [compost metagenome]
MIFSIKSPISIPISFAGDEIFLSSICMSEYPTTKTPLDDNFMPTGVPPGYTSKSLTFLISTLFTVIKPKRFIFNLFDSTFLEYIGELVNL